MSQEIPLSLAAGQLVILPKGFQATKNLLSHIPVTNPVTPIRPQTHTQVFLAEETQGLYSKAARLTLVLVDEENGLWVLTKLRFQPLLGLVCVMVSHLPLYGR